MCILRDPLCTLGNPGRSFEVRCAFLTVTKRMKVKGNWAVVYGPFWQPVGRDLHAPCTSTEWLLRRRNADALLAASRRRRPALITFDRRDGVGDLRGSQRDVAAGLWKKPPSRPPARIPHLHALIRR